MRTHLKFRMRSSIRSLSMAVMACHRIEGPPVNNEVGIGRRAHSYALLQVIETNILIRLLPTKVQTPADYIGVVHQAEK